MAKNKKWGMDYIREHSKEILCINAMWQTSRTTSGPAARDKEAWERNSLVEALVQESKSRYAGLLHTRGMMIRSIEVVLKPDKPIAITHGIDSGYYSHSERIKFSVVCKTLSQHLPLQFEKAKTIILLGRMHGFSQAHRENICGGGVSRSRNAPKISGCRRSDEFH